MRERIDSLEPEALEYLYKFSGNWKKLRIAVALMSEAQEKGKTALAAPLRSSARLVEPQNSAGLPADLFAPGYPAGSNYDTFRATLPGLGAMSDTAGSVPGLQDERCDSNFEAGVAIAAATFAFANIIAENICEALPELADIPCWVAQGVYRGGRSQ